MSPELIAILTGGVAFIGILLAETRAIRREVSSVRVELSAFRSETYARFERMAADTTARFEQAAKDTGARFEQEAADLRERMAKVEGLL